MCVNTGCSPTTNKKQPHTLVYNCPTHQRTQHLHKNSLPNETYHHAHAGNNNILDTSSPITHQQTTSPNTIVDNDKVGAGPLLSHEIPLSYLTKIINEMNIRSSNKIPLDSNTKTSGTKSLLVLISRASISS